MGKINILKTFKPQMNRAARDTYWSPNTVQVNIHKLLNTKEFHNSPHSAYLAVYARMTKRRDTARNISGNPMCPKDLIDRRLNDALSDLMTRNYLEIVNSCVSTPNTYISPSLDLGANFHSLHRTAEKQNWSAVQVALGSTALYLTQHLGLAISTLPHLDELWKETPYKDIPSRVKRMENFKPTYDAFNAFLAKNLVTVAHALKEDGLTKGNRLEIATKISQPILPWSELFGSIRDKTFKLGLNIAIHTMKGQHPWTVLALHGQTRMANRVLEAPPFQNTQELQQDLISLQQFSKSLCKYFSNPLSNIFEGKHYSENGIISKLCPSKKINEKNNELTI